MTQTTSTLWLTIKTWWKIRKLNNEARKLGLS